MEDEWGNTVNLSIGSEKIKHSNGTVVSETKNLILKLNNEVFIFDKKLSKNFLKLFQENIKSI